MNPKQILEKVNSTDKICTAEITELEQLYRNLLSEKHESKIPENHKIYLKSKQNHKTVFVLALDASRAFDVISRDGILVKIHDFLERSLWLMLRMMFENSQSVIVNNGETSKLFPTTIGTKQGSVVAPFLFAIYFEDLIKEIL